jgi:16S rRNA (uracil1498-N3)-methyltransferase
MERARRRERVHVAGPPAPGPLEIEGEEAGHLRVRRVIEGDEVVLFCGDGREWPARVARAGRRGFTLEVGAGAPVDREHAARITLGVALLPAQAFDLVVRQATELGAAALAPVVTARSVARATGASQLERWRRIVIEASKQCGRNRLMEVAPPAPLERFLESSARPAWILVPGAPPLPDQIEAEATLLVGPEGGWAPEEESAARRAGFAPAGLGPSVLRAETAAAAALAIALGRVRTRRGS